MENIKAKAIECDILIPSALENIGNAKIIGEAANGPLNKRGIIIIPYVYAGKKSK
ncbi:MAG: hypothetical protein ACFIN3_00080 [Candidatus Walczuchella monophlebidarum]